ncbi:DUF3857 domain-containing protein [Tamlana flava]|uniref:DUF3857 domain-containing protein n=1 Tax=Tamlana flava TaxID=3158572 RepID=UPI00351BEABE
MKFKILLFLLSNSFISNGQNYKFGKVSEEELMEKLSPLDSSASAAYLYKYRRTHIEYRRGQGFYIVTDVYERIKLYTKEGFDYATKSINLHVSNNEDEEVIGLRAYTYNLENDKIVETKLEKDGIFETQESKYRNQQKFTMPNLKEGSVIEYKYTINSPFYWNVEDFEFQHAIPIKELYAVFETPEYFNFKINPKGFLRVTPKQERGSGKILFSNKVRSGGGLGGATRTTYSNISVDFVKYTTYYNLSDIPALKDEPFVNNINNYRSAVNYELSFTNFPQSPYKYYSTTWEDVVKTIYDSSAFGNELEKTGYFEDEIDALVTGASSPMEKAALIYDFVKSTVKWNRYYGKYTDDGVKKAYQTKTGNVAEINLMLTAMLRYVGLNANPVLISTRNNGIPLFPTLDGYNYVIAAIESPEGVILLDATNEYGTPNVLPLRTLNWEGRIIREDKSSSTMDLYPKQKSQDKLTMMVNLSSNGGLQGSLRSIKTNHDAMIYRKRYVETDHDQYLENLENKYGGMEIEEFSVKNENDLSKPVMESYKFSMESQADVIDDKIYFSPLFFLRSKENPFKLEKREFPIDFSYPSSTKYMVIVNLPEGYKVESIPEPAAMVLPENLGSFKYNLEARGTNIQIIVDTEINEAIISPIYYDALKAYFSKLVEKESEQIVLTKV